MSYLYSASKNAFFIEGIHSNIPSDGVFVSEEEFADLLNGRNSTHQVVPDPKTGRPMKAPIVRPGPSWDDVRYRRDIMLTKTDWTVGSDTPLSEEDQAAWRKYRQKLRDVTKVFDDPNKVVWPMKPASS